jgi:uncharacterized damage-inducible protein DinB
MRERIKWTQRSFNFDFPTGLYPEIIERLRGAAPRMEDHCKDLPTRILIFRDDNRWSIQENAGHLLDLEVLVSQRINEYLASYSTLSAADMSNRRTYEASYNDMPISVILTSFRHERTAIVERLDSLEPEVFGRRAIHPRLNVSMRLVDLLFFTAEHDDYHLTRMNELVTLLGRRIVE